MTRNKYSIAANPGVITFLVNNNVSFVFAKGFQRQRRMVYFIADEETVATLTKMTGWRTNDENDGWDFDGWSAIERN